MPRPVTGLSPALVQTCNTTDAMHHWLFPRKCLLVDAEVQASLSQRGDNVAAVYICYEDSLKMPASSTNNFVAV